MSRKPKIVGAVLVAREDPVSQLADDVFSPICLVQILVRRDGQKVLELLVQN